MPQVSSSAHAGGVCSTVRGPQTSREKSWSALGSSSGRPGVAAWCSSHSRRNSSSEPRASASAQQSAGSHHGLVPAPPLSNSELCMPWMTRAMSPWKAGDPRPAGSTPSGRITAPG